MKEIERYTKAASQPSLAQAPMRTLLEHEVSNPAKRLVTLADTRLKTKEAKRRMAEGKGFEPSIQCYPYNGLANRRLQPLGHPSAVRVAVFHDVCGWWF